MAGRWRDTTPSELAAWLAHSHVPWAFAGGWALDLWSGGITRAHSDIEIACLAGDLARLVESLTPFEIVVARAKILSPLDLSAWPAPPFSLWLRRHGEELWDFEIVVEAHDSGNWHYRRDPRITLPLTRLLRPTLAGFNAIAPEVQLLYKCKDPRSKDIEDLARFYPRLDQPERDWLLQAVELAHPDQLHLLRT